MQIMWFYGKWFKIYHVQKFVSFLWNTECNNSSGLTLLVFHQEGHLACKKKSHSSNPESFTVQNVAQPIETKKN